MWEVTKRCNWVAAVFYDMSPYRSIINNQMYGHPYSKQTQNPIY